MSSPPREPKRKFTYRRPKSNGAIGFILFGALCLLLILITGFFG